MYSDVYHHCCRCLTRTSYNGSAKRHQFPLKLLQVGALFQILGIDIRNGDTFNTKWYDRFMNYLPKWVEACAIPD